MADKMTCPGCDSYTSSILSAFETGNPCPSCGLSAGAISEILAIRTMRADAELTDRYTEALKRISALEREAVQLRATVQDVRNALDRDRSPAEWS